MGILDKIAKQVDWPDEQVGGWMGNGSYLCTCRVCKLYYTGVKHSSCCYPCAEAAVKKVDVAGELAADFTEGLAVKGPNRFWSPADMERDLHEGLVASRDALMTVKPPEPMFVEHWIGWHLGRDGKPAPIICDGNPGYLAHVTKYRFQVPPDVVEHLTGTRECLMLDKFGAMEKDCRS